MGPISGIQVAKFPGVNITTGAASASATLPNDVTGVVPKYVRLAATAACAVRIGKGAQTAVAADLQIQPGDSTIVQINNGWDTIAAIQIAAAGVLNVMPIENY